MPRYKHITMQELDHIMTEFNTQNPGKQDTPVLEAVIVFKASNWKKPYALRSRSYRVRNCCRRFQEGKISNQLSGDCLDGTDQGVRLDWYHWEVEYCYMAHMRAHTGNSSK